MLQHCRMTKRNICGETLFIFRYAIQRIHETIKNEAMESLDLPLQKHLSQKTPHIITMYFKVPAKKTSAYVLSIYIWLKSLISMRLLWTLKLPLNTVLHKKCVNCFATNSGRYGHTHTQAHH